MELRALPPRYPSSSPSPTMAQLGWEAAACGLANLASELDVAVCRLHYYLQRMHGIKAQLDSVWRPTALRMASLEAWFRADVESYLLGVRQDAARLDTAQAALRRLLASDSSSSSPVSVSASGCSSSPGETPRKPVYYRRLSSLSPRKPLLTTLKEESTRSDSDESSEDVKSRKKRKHKKRSERGSSDPALLAAELGKKLKRIAMEDTTAVDSTTSSDNEMEESNTTSQLGTPASSGSESGGDRGGGGVDAPEGATPTSDASGMRVQSSQDSSIARLDSVSPRSALEEISEHQAALHDHLQIHSQRLQLVASTRRRQPRLGEAFADPRALQLAVEAAARELLSAREPLVRRTEALRRLAAAMDEAWPPAQSAGQPPPQQPRQQLRDLPALRLQPLPQLSGARRGSKCLHLWRVLRRWDCADFCATLWDFLSGCFCCYCEYRPSFPGRQQPAYESTWLMRSPPRTYNTCL